MSTAANEECCDNVGPAAPPNVRPLQASAVSADDNGQPTATTPTTSPCQTGSVDEPAAAGTECEITIRVAFFFDGTGNNRKADAPTHKRSNVARLFRSHPQDSAENGLFARYIPGVGTYFPEVGDPGGTDRGLAMAAGGAARLAWAMSELDAIVARYPTDKIIGVQIALFGFSRGAAEARAFAIDIDERCSGDSSNRRWDTGNIPIDIYFMGLFDTVASVGIVATSNPLGSIARAKNFSSIDQTLDRRRSQLFSGLSSLAFGTPGADPTPGMIDGHQSWASDLRIPDMVEHCVSMVAMHEQRNSFPLDSVREGSHYPHNCVEMVYPGMHSDVGGGYAPGAQGRSTDRANMLSQMPLLNMHSLAIEHGVPLAGTDEISIPEIAQAFEVTDALIEHWTHYMDAAGRGGKPLGEMILDHMRYWFKWRFQRIHTYRKNGTWSEGDVIPNQGEIESQEEQFAAERAQQQARVDSAQANYEHAQRAVFNARRRLELAQSGPGPTSAESEKAALARAEAQRSQAEEPYRLAQGRLSAIPSGETVENMHAYDVALMKDVDELLRLLDSSVQSWFYDRSDLRPFYRMILECYEDEFVHDRGLQDQKIIAFFDNYVHDSLAGFASDVTLPSDPRCVYIGGDREAKYANATDILGGEQLAVAEAAERHEETESA